MVSVIGDCDDGDATISPNAAEICDGIDNNCDSSIDGSDAINQITWYFDFDSDGHGDSTVSLEQCDQPTGYVKVMRTVMTVMRRFHQTRQRFVMVSITTVTPV